MSDFKSIGGLINSDNGSQTTGLTNLQYISTKIGSNYPMDSEVFTNALHANGILPSEPYVPGKAFDLAFIDLLMTLLSSADRISEGGYTVEFNADAIRSLLSWYLNKWGLSAPGQPIIRGRRATGLW